MTSPMGARSAEAPGSIVSTVNFIGVENALGFPAGVESSASSIKEISGNICPVPAASLDLTRQK